MKKLRVDIIITGIGHVYVSTIPPGDNLKRVDSSGSVEFELEPGNYQVRIDSLVHAPGANAKMYVDNELIDTLDLQPGPFQYKKAITI